MTAEKPAVCWNVNLIWTRRCQGGKGERLKLAGVGMLRLVGAADLLLELILHFAQTHGTLHSAFQHQKLAAISTPGLPICMLSW